MAKVEKTLNIKEFKSLVKKLIKEEIQKENSNATYLGGGIGAGLIKNAMKKDEFSDFTPGTGGHSGDWDDYFSNDREAGTEMDNMSLKELVDAGYSTEEIMQHLQTIQSPVKEAVKVDRKVAKLNESLEYKKKFVVLEHRRKLIKNILIKEANWLDKLRGKVDPSSDVDNPKAIKNNIDGALAKANKFAVNFNDKVLATTSAINDYHEAISSALDKLSLLSGEQTWMPGMKKEYETKIIDAAKTFYKIMNNEKGRIESFTKTLINDLQDKGLDKSYLTVDRKVAKPSFQVATPKDVEGAGFVDKVIAGAKNMAPAK